VEVFWTENYLRKYCFVQSAPQLGNYEAKLPGGAIRKVFPGQLSQMSRENFSTAHGKHSFWEWMFKNKPLKF